MPGFPDFREDWTLQAGPAHPSDHALKSLMENTIAHVPKVQGVGPSFCVGLDEKL